MLEFAISLLVLTLTVILILMSALLVFFLAPPLAVPGGMLPNGYLWEQRRAQVQSQNARALWADLLIRWLLGVRRG